MLDYLVDCAAARAEERAIAREVHRQIAGLDYWPPIASDSEGYVSDEDSEDWFVRLEREDDCRGC